MPKPNGTIQFCIDFREVNKLATFDAYPMPRPNVLLSQLGETRYLSALTKGYWQVPLRKQDRKKTTSAMPKGLFQFKVMPFGLRGTAATFHRQIDTILGPCEGYMLAYLNVYSQTWDHLIQHLTQVFQCLQYAGL